MSLLRVSPPGPVAVVGDIHGCSDALRRLLAEIGEMPLLVLGDVGDRGPDTRGVVDQLVARRACGTRGNHDDWLIAWAEGKGFDSFALRPVMGGRATLDSYGVVGRTAREIEAERWRVPREHVEWLSRLADAIGLEVGGRKYWLVHAGAPTPPVPLAPAEVVPWWAEHEPSSLHVTPHDLARPPDLGRPVVVAHFPLEKPLRSERVIAIDTGAGVREEAGRLTAVILPEERFVSVEARA
jgi:serine/threonine protein phosphatase 1